MNTFKKTLIALAAVTPVLAFSLPSHSATSTRVENALVEICKAAKSNKVYKLNAAVKSYGLQHKTVATKVVCNGDDIITFSEKHGAQKTAAKLQQSIKTSEAGLVEVNNYAKNF